MRAILRPLVLCIAIIALALVVYWPVTQAKFVSWDDATVVLQNPALTKPFWQRWTHPYLGMYMPMTQSVYQAMAVLGRLPAEIDGQKYNPHVFHWVMLIVRLLNIPVVFLLLRRLVRDDWAAAAGTAIMALHPIGDEAVAWITEVSTPLCTLFAAACLWQWIVYRQSSRHRWAHYSAAFLLYLFALWSKPQCVCVPIMAAAIDIWIVRVGWKRCARDLWPWLLPAAGISLWMKHLQIPVTGVWLASVWQRPLVAVDAIIFYLGKILVPRGLVIDYGRTPMWVLHQPGMLVLECVAIILLAIGLWRLGRRRPTLIAAAVIFLAGLGAVLGFMPFWFQAYSTVADRYVYLPLLGIALVVASLLAGVRDLLIWMVVCIAILACAFLARQQAGTWHDDATLYMHAMAARPNSWVAWDNSAYMLIGAGDPQLGLTRARVAYALDSTQTDVYSNIGMVLASLGNPRQAIPYFRHVVFAKPEDAITAMNLGAAYIQLHQYDLGIKWLEYAHKKNPTSKKIQWLLKGAIETRAQAEHSTTQPAPNRTAGRA